MKSIKTLLALAIILSSEILLGQSPSFYDLTFKADSTAMPYKSLNPNYVFIRSKRGTEPVKPTSSGDSIKTFNISSIVLVFSEESLAALENRDAYNQERWENIMATYPEFFQAKTTYKNICQCSPQAGAAEYKQVQGFYIYYTPKGNSAPKKVEEPLAVPTAITAEPKKEEPKKEVAKEEPKKEVAKVEAPKKEEPKKEVVKEEPKKEVVKEEPKKEEPKKEVVKEEPKKEVAKVETPKKEEPKKKEVVKEEVVKEEPAKPVVEQPKIEPPKEEPKKEVVAAEINEEGESVDSEVKKSTVPSKPKRSKDPKACRPACYGSGESDLNGFFRDNVVLTKKMRKDEVDLKLQLNFDGTVKKVMILGENVELNKLVEEAAKTMVWNATVKAGLTIKSEVRMLLKYDKDLKGLKASNIMVNPRLGPKCLCASDAELFGE